ncbi:hypothetical protein [Nonomuraea sp. NPDC003804]|uniref:hypothetical protein n=1 Tax=Nonomuraea sp. NPDC003804 TaxID=3154547 RepID=UPI0033A2DE2D
MTDSLAHARARAEGPLRLGAGEATPAGMVRLADLAVPVWPDGVTPSLLEEHQVAPIPVERSGETRRVLAACLKCCWVDLSGDPWPGATAPVELVLDTYRALIGRTDDLMRNWAVGALRRLHDSSWVVMADGFVRLGPRCATWPVESYGQLKELVRRLPEADRTALTVVRDADLVAAAASVMTGRKDPADTGMDDPTAPPASDRPSDVATSHGPSDATSLGASDATTQLGPSDATTSHGPSDVATSHGPTPGDGVTGPQAAPAQVEGMPLASAVGGDATAPAGRAREGGEAPPGSSNEGADTSRRSTRDDSAAARPGTDHVDDRADIVDDSAQELLGGRVEAARAEFDDLLDAFDERRRAELVAAFMAVEFAAEPVQEARFAALRDPALRRTLGEMLARRGRTLIQLRERWISGYDAGVAARAGSTLVESERAVLTLVLVHSVAIPRAEGLLPEDTWLSPHATPVEELRRHTQLPIGELEAALRTLRHAGLLSQVKAGEEAGGYVPGPQFHRLTQAARRRLQEELILAAGPHTPLAAAVRAQRKTGDE